MRAFQIHEQHGEASTIIAEGIEWWDGSVSTKSWRFPLVQPHTWATIALATAFYTRADGMVRFVYDPPMHDGIERELAVAAAPSLYDADGD